MTRPPVSVVMPFAGDAEAARAAVQALSAIDTEPEDELILVDNSGTAVPVDGVRVVRAEREHSPAHARNAGAAHAGREWILFLDADCRAPQTLLDDYFAEPVDPAVGALAGEVVPADGGATVAERYGSTRSFLGQRAHLAHGYLPRAVAANLLVRGSAFRELGGFVEGVRAAEDTDFSWRLQRGGWRLELRAAARVEHRYRATVPELRSQWRGYAAGRAWLARRYEGFEPEPAVKRALLRLTRRRGRGPGRSGAAPRPPARRLDRGRFLALDLLLAGDELRGLTQSNRPPMPAAEHPARIVLVADRFPVAGDPLVELAGALDGARVEASERPSIGASAEVRLDPRHLPGGRRRGGAIAGTADPARAPSRALRSGYRPGAESRPQPAGAGPIGCPAQPG